MNRVIEGNRGQTSKCRHRRHYAQTFGCAPVCRCGEKIEMHLCTNL